jgi:pyroglutamyl-peptidase
MKILITGFEPFGRWQHNPSGETAQHFDGMTLGEVQITSQLLPVSFQHAAAPLIAAIEAVRPDIVLNLGLGTPAGVRVERVAVNRCQAPLGGDNDGYDPQGAPVLPAGPATYRSTLPVSHIVDRLATLGFSVAPSDSAGEYLCNFVMYTTLHHISTHKLPMLAGFIHGSPLPADLGEGEQGKGLSLAQWIAFTEATIGVLGETAKL